MLPMGYQEIGRLHEDTADAYYAVIASVALPVYQWEVLRTSSSFRTSGGETTVGMLDALVYRSKEMILAGSPSEAVIPDDQYSFITLAPPATVLKLGDRLRDPNDHTNVFTVKTITATDLLYAEGILERKVAT